MKPLPSLTEAAVHRLAGLEPFPQPPVLPLRHPVVLMHGFGLFATFRRGGHLHGEALHLRARGVHAYAPNVAPYQTVPVRAVQWKDRIGHVLRETGAQQVHLIAHSTGGLDARYLISRMNLHEVVASLTTVSTPHRGASLAVIMLEQPERLRDVVAKLMDWIGETTLEGLRSNILAALPELTPDYLTETFNPAVPDHPAVVYSSYAGAAGKGTDVTINPLLSLYNHLIYQREGINDGLVSKDSARWGRFWGTIEGDHLQQVGLSGVPGASFDSHAFYCSIARRLAEARFPQDLSSP